MKLTFILAAVIALLSACASNVPIEIRQDTPDTSNVSINAVRNDVSRFEGQRVRWGGMITALENKTTDSWIEIVGKELNSYGRPINTDHSLGRFIVRVDGFLDPAIFKTNRQITIYGVIESRVVRQIDEYPYTYPLIKAETYYLWREYPYYPYRYYAHYYPYYYPYRYYYPYHFGFHYGHYYGHHRYHW